MDIYAEQGTKVRFTEEDISESQINWGSHQDPRELLTPGFVYTIEKTEIHSQHTKVFLVEFPGKSFNSVWFEEIQK